MADQSIPTFDDFTKQQSSWAIPSFENFKNSNTQYQPPTISIDRDIYDNGGKPPGFFDKGGTVDRVIQGTGLSNIPGDLSEAGHRFMDNPTPGNIPIVGPSLSAAGRLLTMRSQNPVRDLSTSVPVVGPAANAVVDNAMSGKYPEAFGGAAALIAPGLHGESTPLNLAEGDELSPGVVSRVGTGLKAAGPDLGKGVVKLGTAAALDAVTPAPFRIGTVVGTSGLAGSGVRQMGRGIATGYDAFRGPVEGPEVAPKGFVSPYDTFIKYEPPIQPSGPRPEFHSTQFSPPLFNEAAPGNYSGVRLPSGRVVGGPRPGGAALPSPGPQGELAPASGSFGSGPQSGFSSSSVRPATADELAFENAPRRFVDPLESKIVAPSKTDTPKAVQSRVVQSRAKFDENGKRNQLK